MKTVNTIEVLNLIREHGPVSRAQLAQISRLSKPTVSDQVDSLIAAGLVVDVGTGQSGSRGGKRPALLQMNAAYGCVLSVDVGPERIRFGASDLFGRTLRITERQTRPERGERAVLGVIKRGLADLMTREETSRARLRVISVAAPGIVDVQRGIVLETDNVFGWAGLALGPELNEAYGVDVVVDNDVNMAALAEIKSGTEAVPRSFVLISAHTGIGAAVVFGGDLHHGAHWAAGEIAHMQLDVRIARSKADRRGYLESVVGHDRVMRRLRKAGTGRAAGNSFVDFAAHRSRGVAAVVDDVAAHLASAIANIATVLDPEAILLMGDVFPPLLPKIHQMVARLVPWPVDIRLSNLGEEAPLQGAVVAGLKRAYQQISWTVQAGGVQSAAVYTASGA